MIALQTAPRPSQVRPARHFPRYFLWYPRVVFRMPPVVHLRSRCNAPQTRLWIDGLHRRHSHQGSQYSTGVQRGIAETVNGISLTLHQYDIIGCYLLLWLTSTGWRTLHLLSETRTHVSLLPVFPGSLPSCVSPTMITPFFGGVLGRVLLNADLVKGELSFEPLWVQLRS